MAVWSAYNTVGTVVAYTSQQAAYPASNVTSPHRPFVPWRTTSLVQNDVWVDYGSAHGVGIVIAVNVNYTSAEIYLDTTNDFAVDYSSGTLTISKNPWNERYTLAYLFTAQPSVRQALFRIPTQATTDGATYFSTGGLYVGNMDWNTDLHRWGEVITTTEARTFNRTPSGGMLPLGQGYPKTRIQYQRLAHTSVVDPGSQTLNDEMQTWKWVDFHVTANLAYFGWYLNRGNTSEAWVMQRVSQVSWPLSYPIAESDWTLEEVIGP